MVQYKEGLATAGSWCYLQGCPQGKRRELPGKSCQGRMDRQELWPLVEGSNWPVLSGRGRKEYKNLDFTFLPLICSHCLPLARLMWKSRDKRVLWWSACWLAGPTQHRLKKSRVKVWRDTWRLHIHFQAQWCSGCGIKAFDKIRPAILVMTLAIALWIQKCTDTIYILIVCVIRWFLDQEWNKFSNWLLGE